MNTAFLVTTIAGLVFCVVFVVAFHIKTRGAWWDSPAGRWLMLGRANIALLFLFVVLNRTWDDFHGWSGRSWVLLSLYFLFAAQTIWPLRLLFHAEPLPERRKGKNDTRT